MYKQIYSLSSKSIIYRNKESNRALDKTSEAFFEIALLQLLDDCLIHYFDPKIKNLLKDEEKTDENNVIQWILHRLIANQIKNKVYSHLEDIQLKSLTDEVPPLFSDFPQEVKLDLLISLLTKRILKEMTIEEFPPKESVQTAEREKSEKDIEKNIQNSQDWFNNSGIDYASAYSLRDVYQFMQKQIDELSWNNQDLEQIPYIQSNYLNRPVYFLFQRLRDFLVYVRSNVVLSESQQRKFWKKTMDDIRNDLPLALVLVSDIDPSQIEFAYHSMMNDCIQDVLTSTKLGKTMHEGEKEYQWWMGRLEKDDVINNIQVSQEVYDFFKSKKRYGEQLIKILEKEQKATCNTIFQWMNDVAHNAGLEEEYQHENGILFPRHETFYYSLSGLLLENQNAFHLFEKALLHTVNKNDSLFKTRWEPLKEKKKFKFLVPIKGIRLDQSYRIGDIAGIRVLTFQEAEQFIKQNVENLSSTVHELLFRDNKKSYNWALVDNIIVYGYDEERIKNDGINRIKSLISMMGYFLKRNQSYELGLGNYYFIFEKGTNRHSAKWEAAINGPHVEPIELTKEKDIEFGLSEMLFPQISKLMEIKSTFSYSILKAFRFWQKAMRQSSLNERYILLWRGLECLFTETEKTKEKISWRCAVIIGGSNIKQMGVTYKQARTWLTEDFYNYYQLYQEMLHGRIDFEIDFYYVERFQSFVSRMLINSAYNCSERDAQSLNELIIWLLYSLADDSECVRESGGNE